MVEDWYYQIGFVAISKGLNHVKIDGLVLKNLDLFG